MRSLGLRIATALALGQLAVLALATYLAWNTGSRVLTQQFDQALRDKVESFVALIEQEGARVSIDRGEAGALAPPAGAPRELVTIWGPNGRRLFRSPELGDRTVPKVRGEPDVAVVEDRTVEGREVRLLGLRTRVKSVEGTLISEAPEEGALVTVVVARDRDGLERAQAGLLTGLLAGDLVVLLSAVLIVWWVARRGLAPLRSFGREVGALDVQTLAGRFDPRDHPTELGAVVDGLNDLRARLDDALRREKRLNATLAHEFRTPISELLAMTSVALDDVEDEEFTTRALRRVHEVSGRLTELLDLIRRMVHLEREGEALETQRVELARLVEECVAPHADLISMRKLEWSTDGLDGAVVEANRCALASIVGNFVANAVHYAPEGSSVRCSSTVREGRVLVTFSNPCTDLTPDQEQHLTEPFWRGSTARSDPERHGLGLTIAQGMAALASLDLRLEVRDATFVAEVGCRPG